MRSILAAITMVSATTAFADNLEDLKAVFVRYVAAMKVALTLLDEAVCSETVAKANEYAAAKVAYYKAARRAMSALLQIAKGQETNSGYGNELSEDRDEEVTETLDAKLNRCPSSDQRDQACLAIEESEETAERFITDFGRLDGV
jgi:hypothetical protein